MWQNQHGNVFDDAIFSTSWVPSAAKWSGSTKALAGVRAPVRAFLFLTHKLILGNDSTDGSRPAARAAMALLLVKKLSLLISSAFRRQSFQKAGVGIRGVTRSARLKPLLQVRWAIHNPSSKLAIDWPVAIEP
jgi:hypothetical protein